MTAAAASRFADPASALGHRAARQRLVSLEAALCALDQRIAAGEAGAERERERLSRRFDALYDALEFLDEVLPQLPRCVCGKACHPDRAAAQRHQAALACTGGDGRDLPRLTLPSARSKVDPRPSVYFCLRAPGGGAYHVGHRVLKR